METHTITERDFEGQIRDLAKLFGWKYYHTWRSIHSPAGFPDCVFVRPPRLIFAELKSEKGQVSEKQQEWLDALYCVSTLGRNNYVPEVYLWHPSQIEEIAEILR